MTSGRYSKNLRKMARKQARQAMPYLWAEVKRQFFAMLPRMSFRERVKLAIRILRGKPIEPLATAAGAKVAHIPKGGPSAIQPEKAPAGAVPPPPPVP